MFIGLAAVLLSAAVAGYGVFETTEGDAVEDAWRRVHASPASASAWVALGDAQAARDEINGAEHAYRTALRLESRDGTAYARLGFLLYGQGSDDEARAFLAEAQRRGVADPMLDYTLRNLKRTPTETRPSDAAEEASPELARSDDVTGSAPDAGASLDAASSVALAPTPPEEEEAEELFEKFEECTVAATRRGQFGTFALPVQLDGVSSELVIDTGASMSVITQEMAWEAGLRVDHQRIIRAMTANGRVDFPTARVGTVEVGGRVARDVWVAICPDCMQGYADGLLGLDLQSILGMEFRVSDGAVRFLDCDD